MIRTSLLGALAVVGLTLGGGCASSTSSGEPIGGGSEAVDLTAFINNQIAVANDGSLPSKATGVVFVPFLDSNHNQLYVQTDLPIPPINKLSATTQSLSIITPPVPHLQLPERGTCGVTFVSPHYAITASHCFADINAWAPQSQTFTVETFDVTGADVDSFYLDSVLSGSFPNYQPFFGTMNQVAGYEATSYQCSIASRCAYPPAGASDYNCGADASDVTMLHCAGRATGSPWLPIASDPATVGGAVYMYWFHEIVDTQSTPDLPAHYTMLSGDANNWHYLGAASNVMIPLMSKPWPSAQRTRTGDHHDHDVATDLYGCHGTSGSGVLEKDASGNYELLGPVHDGLWNTGEFLCNDPVALTPGGPGLTYNSNTSVNNLVAAHYSATLTFDRLTFPHR